MGFKIRIVYLFVAKIEEKKRQFPIIAKDNLFQQIQILTGLAWRNSQSLLTGSNITL